jgi:hypothetical protein
VTPEELKALGCQDCPARIKIHRHVENVDGMMRRVMSVDVAHDSTCPWALVNLPDGERTWAKPAGTVRHTRE